MRAKRLLLTGDSLTGAEAAEWGLATEAAPRGELDARFERLLARVARLPINQLVMMKLLTNQVAYAQGLHQTQILGTFFDGITRHTEEGHGFVAAGRRGRLQAGGPRTRRALRRLRARGLRGQPIGSAAVPRRSNSEVTPESIRERVAGFFPGRLGIDPVEISDTRATGRVVVDERHLHPGGYVHGGAWVALADSVAAWGTFRNLPPGHDFTTVEMKLNVFAAAAEGDELIATAEPHHIGARTQVWEVRIHRAERQVALFTVTQFVIEPGPERWRQPSEARPPNIVLLITDQQRAPAPLARRSRLAARADAQRGRVGAHRRSPSPTPSATRRCARPAARPCSPASTRPATACR